VGVTGAVTDRIAGTPVHGSTMTFSGPERRTVLVADGVYRIDDLLPGTYDVTIAGPQHVTHVTKAVGVSESVVALPFSVMRWNAGMFGALNTEVFQAFFDQIARVRFNGAISKWASPPTQIDVVAGQVPDAQTSAILDAVREVNEESVPAMWCGLTAPLPIVVRTATGPPQGGHITVTPNWDQGSSGGFTDGQVRINMFRPAQNRLQTPQELKESVVHEMFHVAFAFHECGGDLGTNPHGFSPTNCPFPDSVMANRGGLSVTRLSAEDKLASCLVYHRDTHPGNLFPDINPRY
jgi:hypothetical protein